MKVSELWRKLAQVHLGGPDEDIGGGNAIATATFTPATYAAGGVDISSGAPESVIQVILTVEYLYPNTWYGSIGQHVLDLENLKVLLYHDAPDEELPDGWTFDETHGTVTIRVLYVSA